MDSYNGFFEKQMIILVSLMTNNQPINGNILSKKCNLSVKTIKKEIDGMNEYLPNYGCSIISRQGQGYELMIIDQPRYDYIKTSILAKYHRNFFFKNNQEERVHFIIRRILANKGTIFIDDLANDSYVSDSIISRDMIQVKTILKTYRLFLKNKTNNGLFIEGSEWNKRLALIYEHRVYARYSAKFLDNDEFEFINLFLPNSGSFHTLYEKIIERLRHYRIFIPYYVLPKVVYLIILSITRRKYNQKVRSHFNQIGFVPSIEAKRAMMDIFEYLEQEHGVILTEEDAVSIAIYINSFEIVTTEAFRLKENHQEIKTYADQFLDYFTEKLMIKDFSVDQLKTDLCNNLYSLIVRVNIGVQMDSSVVSLFMQQGIASLDYCFLLYKFIRDQLRIDCSINDAVYFFHIFTMFRQQHLLSRRKRIAVVSRYGFLYAKNMAQKFSRQENAGRFDFTALEFLEVTQDAATDFYCIATDIDRQDFQIESVRIIQIHYFRKNAEFRRFFSRIDHEMLPLFTTENLHYPNKINSLEKLFDFLDTDLFARCPGFVQGIKEQSSLIPPLKINQVMVLSSIEWNSADSFIECLILDRPIKVGEDICSLVIVYNAGNNDIVISHFLNEMISSLLHNHSLTFSYNRKEDYQLLRHAFKYEMD